MKTHRMLSVAAISVLAATAAPAGVAYAGAPGLRDQEIGAMAPDDQARLLDPLRDLAEALDSYGRSGGAAFYTGVAIDANHDLVDLYLTDTAEAGKALAAARRTDPEINASLVRVHRSAATVVDLHAARNAFISQAHSFKVYAAGISPDGNLTVEVPDPIAATKVMAAAKLATGDVHITFVHGTSRTAKSWDDAKWHDSAPFIGGDVITSNGEGYCTTGLPAVRQSDGHPLMVTAAHCFGLETKVYTAGGTTWQYGNGQTGNYVGKVTARNTTWDAEVLDGANNNADESDTSGWKPLTSVAYSYVGDYVCHSGARSASMGHPTPCGIKVTDADLWFPIGGYSSRGVEGVDTHGWGSVNGDSGGTVFGLLSGDNRQARGIVSSGGADGTPDQARVDWVEATDIFNAFGLKLNPQT
jgi:hypothetical protein